MTKKVLLVSWHFPPYKSSSAFNLFKRLKDTGYEYDVLQISRAEKPDNEGMFRFAVSRFNRYEIAVPSENARDPLAREVFVDKVLDVFHELRKINHYRVIVSHSHEIVSHMAALAIKTENPDLRWVASFGDPIAANPFNESYKFPLLEEDSRTEANVLQQADRILVTNPYQKTAMAESQAQHVPDDKFFVLPHCFDDRMYPQSREKETTSDTPAGVFRFRHVGMLYKFKRTAEPFMRGAQRLLEKRPELNGRFIMEFYGANDRFIQGAKEFGLEDTVSFKGTVNYLESLAVMADADCLLLRDADFSDQGLKETPFYPGKLADYLGARKPVLSVTMAQGCVPDMLSRMGGASLTETNIEGIADAMYAAICGNLNLNVEESEHYSYRNVSRLARQALDFPQDTTKVLIAGHDLKFAKFIMSAIEQRDDLELLIDQWQGHEKHDEKHSRKLLDQADTILCEWGLGNAVWYSKHKKAGQKLMTRVHAQELRTRHLDRFNHGNVDRYIFVSPHYFELMIAEFGLPRHKCAMVYNMVDVDLLDRPKLPGSEFHLGVIGDVPRSKRLDRALDIFEALFAQDMRYKLFVKGKRPEEYPWMHSEARKPEMDFYRTQYKRIEDNGWQDNVIFEGYGHIDEWLQKIGFILSVSDFESFHLAPAEGMASGALPIVFNWHGSSTIYPSDCIVGSVDEAVNAIVEASPLRTEGLKKYAAQRFCGKQNAQLVVSMLDSSLAPQFNQDDEIGY